MGVFSGEVSIHGISIDILINASVEQKKRVRSLIEDKIKRGAIKPLARTVFVEDRVEAAFRYMAAGKHVGKVLIKFRNDDEVRENLPHALPRFYCLEDSSYLIHGGLGTFGVELAEWLVLRGAKKLVLTSRRGIRDGYQRRRVHLWKSHGVEVLIIVGKDASTEEGCEAILKEAEALGPLDGIFHLAAERKNNLCENQTIRTFEDSIRVKAVAAKQFDKISTIYCTHLRHFLIFSSISSGRGCARLANDGMANSIIEKMCEIRLSTNLPALAVEWGPIREVGILADVRDHEKIGISGVLLQEIHSCLEQLDGFLQQKCPVVASTAVVKTKSNNSGSVIVTDVVADIIGLKDMDSVDQNKSLAKLGLDFMMAVVIRSAFEREFEIFMTIQEIENLNLAKLRKLSAEVTQYEEKYYREATTKGVEKWTGMKKLLVQSLRIKHTSPEMYVPLKTREEPGRSEVFILPGIDGDHSVFEKLAAKLKSRASCLELITTFSKTLSIDDIVDVLLPHVRARTQDQRNFVIAAYSFGSVVAIELARRLESEGFAGRLVLIDGAPLHFKAIADPQLLGYGDDDLQSNILVGLMEIVAPYASKELSAMLPSYDTWDDKLEIFWQKIPESVKTDHSFQSLQLVCTAIYQRIKAALSYDPWVLPRIKSPIVLLRPTAGSQTSLESVDYGLASVTQGKVEILFVEGNHTTILDSDECAAAINGDPIEETETVKSNITADTVATRTES